MFNRTMIVSALVVLSGCAAPVDLNEEQGDEESVAEAQEAVTGAACTSETADESTARTTMNQVRTLLGMGAINCNNKLQTSARAHAKYQGYNNLPFSHNEQDTTLPYYYENTWQLRADKAGFTGNKSQEVGATNSDPTAVITGDYGFMNMVYHRIPFVNYYVNSAGLGNYISTAGTKRAFIDMGKVLTLPSGITSTSLSLWPAPGATGIWTTFHCAAEAPRPIANCPAGYVSSITGGGNLSITSHEFRTSSSTGTLLARTLLTSANDVEGMIPATQVYLVPTAPLAANTKYFVKFVGTVSGSPFTKSWTFTTGAT